MTYLVSPNPYSPRTFASSSVHNGEQKSREDFEREIDLLWLTSIQGVPGITGNAGVQSLWLAETRLLYQREITRYKNEITKN